MGFRIKTASILSALTLLMAISAEAQVSPLYLVNQDVQNGFPVSISDSFNTTLGLCLDPVNCFFDPPVAGNDFSQQIGFGAEAFWFSAEATLSLPAGTALFVAAVEAAWNDFDPAAGTNIPFTRLRFRMPVAAGEEGAYTITHPYGVEVFDVPVAGPSAIFYAADLVFTDIFNASFAGNVGPFLAAANPPPPAGFLGNPSIQQTVTGSPFGTNFLRIEGPPGANLDGAGGNIVETDLFAIQGRLLSISPLVADPGFVEVGTGQSASVAILGGVGGITVTSSDMEVAMVTLRGRTIIITGEMAGTATVLVSDSFVPANTVAVAVTVHSEEPTGSTWLLEDFETGNLSKFPWLTGGDGMWSVSPAKPYNGIYSAQTPDLNDNQRASLETSAYCQAGEASFWFSVDSEENYDFLEFYVDDELVGAWSGFIHYTRVAWMVDPGVHTYRWSYVKDQAESSGADSAWVDDIRIPGHLGGDGDGDGVLDDYDAFPNDPHEWEDTDGDGVGNNADDDDDDDGYSDEQDAFPGDPTEWWDRDGDGIGDNTDLDDDGDLFSDNADNCPGIFNPGQWDSDGDGAGDACDPDNIEDFENGDLGRFPWIVWGAGLWGPSTSNPDAGSYAAQSPSLPDRKSASMEITMHCVPGEVGFRFAVDSERDNDFLSFYIDEQLMGSWSGAVDYTRAGFPVAEGIHGFKWTYGKDESNSGGLDSAWLDNVSFPISGISVAEDHFETGDLSFFPWEFSGNGLWDVTTSNTQNGNYAARTPLLGNNQIAAIQTTLYCLPGEMTFWYSVSSQQGKDLLAFYIDDELAGSWSGSVDYTQASYPVSAGIHTFSWEYSKDESGASGSDAAWIDHIAVTAPSGTDSDGDRVPDTYDAFPNDPAEWVDADGDGVGDNTDSDDDNDGYPDDRDAFPLNSGEWKDSDGDGMGDNADSDDDNDFLLDWWDNCTAVFNPMQGDSDGDGIGDACDSDNIEDFETGDLSRFPWVAGGAETWELVSTNALEGAFAVKSPPISDGRSASLEITIHCRRGEVGFWYAVSSEQDKDTLSFYVDDVLTASWSGSEDYTRTTHPITEGIHHFKWVYAKDDTGAAGLDAAWLDNISFPISHIPVLSETFETGDLTGLSWQSSGTGAWEITNAGAHGGTYAAQAPALGDGENSILETALYCEPGEIAFWLAVSSQQYSDRLLFYIDDSLEGSWSGSVDYTRAAFPISGGIHRFKWAYAKNSISGSGMDSAWIDDIAVTAPAGADSDGDGVIDGHDAFPENPDEWMDSDGDGIGDNGDNCRYVHNPDQRDTNFDGIGDACDAVAIEDFETGDLSRFNWVTQGNEYCFLYFGWLVTKNNPHSGNFSGQSPPMGNLGRAWLKRTEECNQGEVSFWLAVDSEAGKDYLKFFIDDVPTAAWSGAVDYTRASFPVSSGTHTFTWEYAKDETGAAWNDFAWIDDVVIPVRAAVVDTDLDGMPDSWEEQYGLNPLTSDADGDRDFDGFSNLQEYIAGTDPNDPNSNPGQVLKGDVNDDGNVDLHDAILALQVLADISPSDFIFPGADVNGDGCIGIEEVLFILQKSALWREADSGD